MWTERHTMCVIISIKELHVDIVWPVVSIVSTFTVSYFNKVYLDTFSHSKTSLLYYCQHIFDHHAMAPGLYILVTLTFVHYHNWQNMKTNRTRLSTCHQLCEYTKCEHSLTILTFETQLGVYRLYVYFSLLLKPIQSNIFKTRLVWCIIEISTVSTL